MTRASELEAQRLAKERTDARCEVISAPVRETGMTPEGVTLLERLADQMLIEATYVAEQRKAGWKSRSNTHTAAARILEQWAKDLAAYLERDKPPTRPPLETIKSPDRHADLDPADGPISAQITSGLLSQARLESDGRKLMEGPVTPDFARRIREAKTVDDKLDVAFGPVSPRAEIINLQCRAEYPRKGSDDRSGRIVRCGKRAGHHSQHAEWISGDYNDGASGWGPEWDLPATPGGPAGPITPDAATRVRPAIEADHTPGSDATLAAAFDQPKPDPSTVHITAAPANYAWCDATTGLRGDVGSATCPDCIARWDAYDEAANKALALTKGEPTVSIPQFSEPGAPSPRQTQRRLTFAQVRGHGQARARGADHRSYSQVQAFKECGVKYALDDLDTPAWWNVGGTALHYACEVINRQRHELNYAIKTDQAIETLWTNFLGRATSEAIAEHPTVDTAHWRAAKKGAEGYDWWRVNGVDMVRRWVTRLTWLYDQGWRVAEFNGVPAIEYDCPMWIGSVKVENIIDLVMTRGDGTLLIIDAKGGASAPDDTAQLGQYAHALDRHVVPPLSVRMQQVRIIGAYWLARTDMLTPVDVTKSDTATDLRELHPWDGIEYLITTMHAAESAGLYLPNKSKSDRFGCGSCGVRGLCPVGPS